MTTIDTINYELAFISQVLSKAQVDLMYEDLQEAEYWLAYMNMVQQYEYHQFPYE